MAQDRIELQGSNREAVAGASQVSPVNKHEMVQATVVLRRRSGSQVSNERLAAESLPPQMARQYSREEFGTIHGADPRDIEAIEEFAHENGLTVVESSAARRSVVLQGPAEAMETAFRSPLAHYETPRGRYRGRTGSIMLPSHLEGVVTAVLGLDNRPVAKPHFRVSPKTTPPPGAFTPVQLAQLYNFPNGVNGAGQTIGIIELGGGYRASDLSTYFKDLGISPKPRVSAVSVDGGQNHPGGADGADGEVMLDIEVAGAVAPGARIVVYFAPNTDQGFHDAITKAVHDPVNKPSVLSISWGGPEDSWTSQARNAMSGAFQDAAAIGVTITVAAGDDGASDGVAGGQQHVDLPACIPDALACGGTKVAASGGSITSETVWNELAKQEGATGGGVSRLFPIPIYQSGAGVPAQPDTSFKGRGVPDVSGDADPESGYIVRVDGKNSVIGGTSAVAPLWAGLIALLNQSLGKPLGFANPRLYQIGSSAFRDVTQGDNGYFKAGDGWDACTGLGSPSGMALLKVLLGSADVTKAKMPGAQEIVRA